jgi:hypothetical protein
VGLKNIILSLLGRAPAEERFAEAAGLSIDSEEGWRKLTGNSDRDINPITQERMQKLALYQWRSNPVANRLIELPVAFLLAEGVTLRCEDEEAQGWLDLFWNDPVNRLDLKLVNKVRELAIYGEQCWPVFVNEMNGHVRLGYLDPGLIATVVTDPDNIEQPIGVVTKRDKKGVTRRFRVIVNGPEEVFSKRTREIRAEFDDGECFYYSINGLSNSTRGVSDLLPLIDWIDAYDQALFGELERWDFLRAFIYDVTLKGATPDEVRKRASEISAPRPGSVRVHNESEEWNALAPDLKAADSEGLSRLFRNHIIGGATVPEHWFGGGGDVNRATAGEMGEPTFKIFTLRQRLIRAILEEIGTYQVRQRCLAVYGAEPSDGEKGEYEVRAEFPELTARDTSKYAAALQQVVVAAVAAVDRGMLSRETAVMLVGLVSAQLGLEIDPATEIGKIEAERTAAAEADVFRLPPDDDEDEAAGEAA